MYLPVPPRRGCGRYRKGTHAPPSPCSRSPISSGSAPPGSGARYARLRSPPVAAPPPVGTASPAPFFLFPFLPHPGPAPPFFSPSSVQVPSSPPPGSSPSHGHRAQPRFPGEPACSCRAAHIITAAVSSGARRRARPRRPLPALGTAPGAPRRRAHPLSLPVPGNPMNYGQIALGISRFTAPSAVGVAAALAGEDSLRGEVGNAPSVRREPLFLHAGVKPPSLSPGLARLGMEPESVVCGPDGIRWLSRGDRGERPALPLAPLCCRPILLWVPGGVEVRVLVLRQPCPPHQGFESAVPRF